MENQKEITMLKDLGMLYPNENSIKKRHFILYKCFCGNEFKARKEKIQSGYRKNCGCDKKSKTHNLTNHILYQTWANMINRCTNPKSKDYINYGGRGITVCDRWFTVTNFIEDMYPSFIEGLTLDRINVNGNYNKDNCRWATRTLQNRNTRKLTSKNKTGFRGVYKSKNKYIAYVYINNKGKYIGTYDNPIEGAKARDKYIIDNNLEHTKNF